MRLPDLIIFFGSIAGVIAGRFLLVPPYSWGVVTLCALFGAWSFNVALSPRFLSSWQISLVTTWSLP